jgi:hypothetical protein
MGNRRWLVLLSLVLVFSIGSSKGLAQAPSPQTKAPGPDISGEWTGDWGPFNPASGMGMVKGLCKTLIAKVEYKKDVWEAAFEGDCGRPYKYMIKMEGRQVGKAVLFKGTVDLGEKDGGVFDWIGKANEKEFVGFFTSAGYTGLFVLTRKP